MLLKNHKEWEKMINCNFYSPKTAFLAIFANFGQLWMVVKPTIIKNIFIFHLHRMHIGVT